LVGGIYLRQGDEFVPMREQRYEAESVLQALIADHPEVLAGDEQGAGRAWLLVRREAGIADSADTGERFSLDHLFLDQDGVPTLVEVKRSSDTRGRREVVAQMLDYAANATAYWKVESLRAWFETECERQGRESLSVLATAFGISDEDDYWRTVQRNLAADRIRLVFVGDEIAPELRSIVEFLNRQLTDTEVLVIEVKQYVDADGKRQTIVPRLLGQTEEAKAAKSGAGRPTRQWDRRSLLEELARRDGERTAGIARSLIDWADGRDGVRVLYGQGARSGSAQIRLGDDGALLTAFNVWSYGAVEIPFDFMISAFQRNGSQTPFGNSRQARDELRRRINDAVPGANIPSEDDRIRPSFSLTALADEDVRHAFFAAVEWAFDQARASPADT
jgi:hypothetical protein